jgi:hypothetical protein
MRFARPAVNVLPAGCGVVAALHASALHRKGIAQNQASASPGTNEEVNIIT